MIASVHPQQRADLSLVGAERRQPKHKTDLCLKRMVDTWPSGVVILGELGEILEVNPAWRKFAIEHGYLIDNYGVGLNYFDLRLKTSDASSDEGEVIEGIHQVLQGKGSEFDLEYFSRNATARRWVRIHAFRYGLPAAQRVLVSHDNIEAPTKAKEPCRDEQCTRPMLALTSRDGQQTAARVGSLALSGATHNEAVLRELTGRLINAQEEERKRVARELHDDLNQRMALLSIELEQIGQEVKKPLAVHRRLEDLQSQAREISTDIHQLSYRLHPSKLDHLGLAAAVKSLCQEISAKGKLVVDFQQSGFPATLAPDVTLCVFRIAQEALRNCVKHSRASVVRVMLEHTEREIRLSVMDDGCGFDVESEAMEKGLGFTSMRERLRIVEGTIEFRSQPMHGTVIEVSVPLALSVGK
jgi:signal transduction histidine kinase